MCPTPSLPSLLIEPDKIEPFSRGNGVTTLPYVGAWNSSESSVTTGITIFGVGTAIPLHTHNVDESVLVLQGEGVVTIGETDFEVSTGMATWVPAGTPHCFKNRGSGEMRIYWVYGGLEITRTICATGQTFAHLSEQDRGAVVSPSS